MELTKIKAPDGSEIYIQYDEDELTKGLSARNASKVTIDKRTEIFKNGLESNIKTYSTMVMEAVKGGVETNDDSNLKSIELEFGVQIGGEAGIPFITKGTIQSNIKVKVAWEFK